MPIANEDAQTFTPEGGQPIAKTPEIMAPGGLYDQLKGSRPQLGPISSPPATASTLDAFRPGFQGPPSDLKPTVSPADVPMPGVNFNSASPDRWGMPDPLVPNSPMALKTGDADPNQSNGAGVSKADPKASGMPGMNYGTTTKSGTQTTSMSPAASAALDKAGASAAKAFAAKADLEAQDAAHVASFLENQTKNLQMQNRAIQDNEDRRQLRIQTKMDEVRKVEDKYMNAKVDPDHLWGDEGTGNKFLAAIGIALGAIGSAITGKDNLAIKVVTEAIDRDIAVQKANIEKMGKSVEFARGGLQDLRNVLGDEKAAEEAERGRQLQIFANQLEALKQGNISKEAKANADVALSQLNLEIAKIRANTEKVINTSETINAPVKGQQMPALPVEAMGKLSAKADALRGLQELRALKQQVDTGLVSGTYGELAKKFNLPVSASRVELQTAVKQQALKLAKSIFGGQMSDEDRATVEQIFPNGKDTNKNFDVLLNRIEKETRAGFDADIKAYVQIYRVPDFGAGNNGGINFTPNNPTGK